MSTPTTSLTCRELVELVTDYLEGVLPESERARFAEHIDCCGWCLKYTAQMRETVQVVGHVEPETVPPDVEAQLLSAFRSWKTGQA
jgi:predicted anti-sigma-YlaC factor YlaD